LKKKFRAFWAKVILSPNGPLGNVENFFWRREYQLRGIPHCHSKIWVRDAPVYGKDSDEIVLKYITDHVTCRIPDKDKKPELYDLVMKFQFHRCTSSCQKLIFNKITKKKAIRCRYGFPRPIQQYASLNSVKQALQGRKGSQKKRARLYNLKRTKEEVYINDYNPELLLLWGNNIDLQFIATNEHALNKYVTGYICKQEKKDTANLWEECNKNRSLRGALKTYAMRSFKTREVGIYEAADKLNGYALYQFSCQIVFMNPREKNERLRRLKDNKDINLLDDNSDEIYHNNLIDNYYPNRPNVLEDICLYDFASNYNYSSKSCNHMKNANQSKCFALLNDLGFICRRQNKKIIKIPHIKPVDAASFDLFHALAR